MSSWTLSTCGDTCMPRWHATTPQQEPESLHAAVAATTMYFKASMQSDRTSKGLANVFSASGPGPVMSVRLAVDATRLCSSPCSLTCTRLLLLARLATCMISKGTDLMTYCSTISPNAGSWVFRNGCKTEGASRVCWMKGTPLPPGKCSLRPCR